jgi:hypothetical protein
MLSNPGSYDPNTVGVDVALTLLDRSNKVSWIWYFSDSGKIDNLLNL